MVEHLRGTGEVFIDNEYFTDVCYELEARADSHRIAGQIYTLGYHPALLLHLYHTSRKTILWLSDGRQVEFLIPHYDPPADSSDIAGTWLFY